jgi:hypothetical protein
VGKLASKLGIVDATGKANPTPDQRLAINATAAVLVMAMAIGTSENTTQGLITAFREFITPTPFPPPPAPAPPWPSPIGSGVQVAQLLRGGEEGAPGRGGRANGDVLG